MATNQGTRIWDVNAEASLTGIEKIPMGKGGSAPAVTTVNKLKTFINADRAPVLDLSTMSAGKSLSNNSGEYRFVYNGNPTHSVIIKYNSKLYEVVCCNHSADNIGTYYYCFEGKNCTNVWTEVTLPDWAKECMFEYIAKDAHHAVKTLGPYTDRSSIQLTAAETGVAIDKNGKKIAKSGWAIAEMTVEKGNEYLFAPGTLADDVCIFAEKITKREVRNVDYKYTYNTDGTVKTATAAYNGATHSYTFTYTKDGSGNIIGETITDDQTGEVLAALPYSYVTSIGEYQPMTVLNAASELPKDGKCRLVSHFQNDASLTVTVSYHVATANLTVEAIRDGFTASICTQLSNIAKRIANLSEYVVIIEQNISAHNSEINELVQETTKQPKYNSLPMLAGQPAILFGAGTPQEAIVPDNWQQFDPETGEGYNWTGVPSAIGQQYINTTATTGGRYIAVRDGYYGLKWLNC